MQLFYLRAAAMTIIEKTAEDLSNLEILETGKKAHNIKLQRKVIQQKITNIWEH